MSYGVHRSVADRHQRQRVAVGRALRDRRHRNIAGRADAVLDDHALVPGLRKAIADHARERIRRPAGREADQDADRF
jgi:hypothetical protein